MDELSAKLAEILNDPDSMQKVQQMAENLLGDGGAQPPAPEVPPVSGDFDPKMMGKIMSVMNSLKNTGDDARTQLLTALRPHLGEKRREKLDTAIKLLRIIDMLPLLRSSGLLDF